MTRLIFSDPGRMYTLLEDIEMNVLVLNFSIPKGAGAELPSSMILSEAEAQKARDEGKGYVDTLVYMAARHWNGCYAERIQPGRYRPL